MSAETKNMGVLDLNTVFSSKSTLDQVSRVASDYKDRYHQLNSEAIAYMYCAANLTDNINLVGSIDGYLRSVKGEKGVAIRTCTGLALAGPVSDTFLVWMGQIDGADEEKYEHLQNQCSKWIVEGLTSKEVSQKDRQILRSMVVNLLGRVESGDSILDTQHKIRIMTKGKITEKDLSDHASKLIEEVSSATLKEYIKQVFGSFEE